MRARHPWFRTLIPVLALGLAGLDVHAQEPDPGEWLERCRSERSWGDSRERVCEVREVTLAAGPLTVDGRQNGGVSVQGWDQDGIRVLALVSVQTRTEAQARADAQAIRIRTDNRTVRAEGPDRDGRGGWSVSYRVFVPRATDLSLRANNGGIRVADVRGRIGMETHNGGISLMGLAGDVRGRTQNGGLDIRLDGDRWQGEGLNVETQNGGVTLAIPRDYSARLETGTVNGGMRIDFPVTVQGEVGKRIDTRLGEGGAPIRAVTTNGGVTVRTRGGGR